MQYKLNVDFVPPLVVGNAIIEDDNSAFNETRATAYIFSKII